MNSTLLFVLLYASAFLVSFAIMKACDTLPECASPRFLRKGTPGNVFLDTLSFSLLWFGGVGLVTLSIPGSENLASLAVAGTAAALSLIRKTENESIFR